MKLAYAILADTAQVMQDGKISILGGDFDTIRASSFPHFQQTMSIVARFDVTIEEGKKNHQLRIEFIGPLGGHANPSAVTSFRPKADPSKPDRPLKFLFVANLQGVLFETVGKYTIRISVDGNILGDVLLYLEKA